MSAERKIILALVAVLVLILGVFGWNALKAHEAIAVANAQQVADKKAQKDIAEAQTNFQKQIEGRDEQQAEFQKQIAKQMASVHSTSQAAAVIDHYLPAASPAVINPAGPQLPDAPTPQQTITLNQAQSVAISQRLLQCDADNKAAATCKSDLADTNSKFVEEKKATKLAQDAAVRWENVAKGGSFWQRVKHDAIVIGVTAGVAYAAGRITK